MKHAVRTALILVLCVMSLCSCNAFRPRGPQRQMVRTTVTYPVSEDGPVRFAAMGVGTVSARAGQTVVTEMPYESPAYTAAGQAMFSRP